MKDIEFEEYWNSLSLLWQANISHGLGNDYSLRGKIPSSFEEFDKVKQLHLSQHANLEPLSYFANLEALSLSAWTDIDYTNLSKCINLKELELANTDISDLNWISPLKKLKKLRISKTSIKSIAPLSTLPELQKIDISETEIDDWKPLESIPKLSELYAIHCNTAIDLDTVSKLKNLKLLDIRGNEIESLDFIAALKKIKCIWDVDCNDSYYEILKTLPKLNQIGCRKEVFEEIRDWFADRKMYYNVEGKEITLA